MSDEQLIDEMATLWVENGGDVEGIDWCWMRLKEAVEVKQQEKQTGETKT